MEKDIGMECFTARLWEQQTKLNLTDEELFYGTGDAGSLTEANHSG
jgi:hypothetical protein